MLYQTTRNKIDIYTSYRALREDGAKDGGCFLPLRTPDLSDERFAGWKNNSVFENIAVMLNCFFDTKISPWDIECAVGKKPISITSINQKVIFAELWDNPKGSSDYLFSALYACLLAEDFNNEKPTLWARIAIRISLLFAVMGQLKKDGIEHFDVALYADDLEQAFAVAYFASMGAPIDIVVVSCDEKSGVWDFASKGILNGNAGLMGCAEQFLYIALGRESLLHCLEYTENLSEEELSQTVKNLFVSVIGKDRIPVIISNVQRTFGCKLDCNTAASFGALQDYRAKSGESRMTVLFMESNPNTI